MQEKTPTNATETFTPETANGTRPHTPIANTNGRQKNFSNTSYRLQHVDKQMKDVTKGELQFWIGPVPNQASVPLNENMNLELLELCSARVPIPCTAT